MFIPTVVIITISIDGAEFTVRIVTDSLAPFIHLLPTVNFAVNNV